MPKSKGQIKSEAFEHLVQKSASDVPDNFAEIQKLAYFKAQRRNFEPGHELDDWLEAEKELGAKDLNM